MAAGERTVRVRFDGSAAGLTGAAAKARAELKALQQQVDTNKKNLEKFSNSVGTVAQGFGLLALRITAIGSGIHVVTLLSQAMLAASGAAGLLPAAILGGVAALLAFKLGADGIKAAFSQLNPQITALKANVSAAFEASLLPAVKNLKVLLPQVTGGFRQIATASGGVLTSVTGWARTPVAVRELNTILSGTAQIIRNVGAAFAPLVAAFVRIGAVATPILVGLTAGIGGVADRFNAWVQRMADSGAVTDWIQTAIDFFHGLFATLGDIVQIVGSVLGAFQDAGAGITGVFGPVIGIVKQFVQSAQGHDVLVALATAVQQVGDAVGRVLGAALKAVGPAIPDLADAFGKLATQVANVLVPVIEKLGPVLQSIAKFLSDNMSWLGPITIAVGAFAAAIWLVNAAIEAWEVITGIMTAIQWLLNAALFANPIGIVVLAILALIGVIVLVVTNLGFFRGIWDAVWKWCSDRITDFGHFVGSVWDGITSAVGVAVDWVKNAWSNTINAVRGFFSGLGSFVGGIWDGIIGGVKSAINAVIRVVNGVINGVNTVTGVVGIPAIPHIPQLAKGGTALGGRAYLVGEAGPELFVPGQTGRVVNATTTAEAIGGGAQTIALTLDLGEGIQQAFEIKTDRANRATVRALTAGVGASR